MFSLAVFNNMLYVVKKKINMELGKRIRQLHNVGGVGVRYFCNTADFLCELYKQGLE